MMDDGKVKCVRLISIFVVSGFLCAALLFRLVWGNTLLDTLIILLSVLLLSCLVEWCWKPILFLKCSSDNGPTDDDAVPIEPSTPLVNAEEPPSYDQVILQDRQSSVLSLAELQGSRQLQGSVPGHGPPSEEGESEGQRHSSGHGAPPAYSPYSVANEIQLSVDGLPSYNDVVASMQETTRHRSESNSNDGYSVFI
ncbi:uncharacterized protein LOC125043766 [Penaeus chinensis]|uniref:uncharacterized protein LOC125043766 n=1 Tax=Penaeus chinensis TaxID=139456 RepID=UPI001FB5CD9B|nr:uncharacterized protein LOC125043766 [Penaeus chinensis]XP_047495997.1 uncharacterized protein LOC125043766 [Penaeus chinensis]